MATKTDTNLIANDGSRIHPSWAKDLDEGEHTDDARLRALADALSGGSVRLIRADADEARQGLKLGIHLATPKPLPLGQWHTQHGAA